MSPKESTVVEQSASTRDSATEHPDSARTQRAGDDPSTAASAHRMTVSVAILGIVGTIAAAIVSPLLSCSQQPVIVGAPIDKTVVVVHTVIVERTVVVTSAP
jgi:hypothetical protein